MGYGKVSPAYWHDDKIRELTEAARHFMLYLMSCPHGNRLGLFVLDPMYAASDVQWYLEEDVPDVARVRRVLTELRDGGRILWDARNRVVFVRYYLRHNSLANQSVVKGAMSDLSNVPRTGLLGDLLDTVIDEQKGPAGPIKAHYAELEAALRTRIGAHNRTKSDNGVDTSETHGVGHGAVHSDVHRAGTVGHTVGRARARAALPNPTLPNPTLPSLTDPTLTDRAVHGAGELSRVHVTEPGGGEDEKSIEEAIAASLPAARQAIVAIHGGTEEPVTIGGHEVGVGIEVDAYKRLCRARRDPPDIIAAAIGHLPTVSGLEPPVSLARWGAEDGGPIYEECVGLVYRGQTPLVAGVELPTMPPADREAEARAGARKAELREQIEQIRENAGGAT